MDTRGWINELSMEILLQQLTNIETGFIPAFAISIPIAVWGFVSYIRQRRKEPGVKQGKNYNESRGRASTVSAVWLYVKSLNWLAQLSLFAVSNLASKIDAFDIFVGDGLCQQETSYLHFGCAQSRGRKCVLIFCGNHILLFCRQMMNSYEWATTSGTKYQRENLRGKREYAPGPWEGSAR